MTDEKTRKRRTEATRRWRLKNPDKVKERKRRYEAQHHKEINDRRRQKYRLNPDKILNRQKKRYKENPEPFMTSNRNYRLRNPEKVKAGKAVWFKKTRWTPERIAQRNFNRRQWYARNREKGIEASKQWQKKHPEHVVITKWLREKLGVGARKLPKELIDIVVLNRELKKEINNAAQR